MTRRAVSALVVLTVLATTATACSEDDPTVDSAAHRPTTTRADPTIPARAPMAPLTGLALEYPAVAFRAALVVKIDNLDAGRETARPQAGIATADVVVEEMVEGGITRLFAIFQSARPDRVGPVRSARTTDLALVSQLNRPLFAWSGGNVKVVAAVHDAPLLDVGVDVVPGAYQRDESRRQPHNLYVRPADLYDRDDGDAHPPPPMFQFRLPGEDLSPGAEVVRGVRIEWGGISSVPVSYSYDARSDTWRRDQAGTPHVDADGTPVAPRNVVILFSDYVVSPADPLSPEARTVGSGEAWVLTKGRVVKGFWNRPTPDRPAELATGIDRPIKLTAGRTWVELARRGSATLDR